MNDQNETTASPSEPKLCKMGCGFFVSSIGVPCILKFSFDFGDVLFSDDMGAGLLGTSACLKPNLRCNGSCWSSSTIYIQRVLLRSTVEAALDHGCRYSIYLASLVLFHSRSQHQLTTSLLSFPKSQGSNATGDCCSKCYNAILKKEGATATATQPTTPTAAAPAASVAVTTTAAPTNNNDVTMTEATSSAPVQPTTTVTAAAEPEKKKKKKKKVSYKSMMANMTAGNGSPRDAEKEKEGIKKVTGGGAFSKIDKI